MDIDEKRDARAEQSPGHSDSREELSAAVGNGPPPAERERLSLENEGAGSPERKKVVPDNNGRYENQGSRYRSGDNGSGASAREARERSFVFSWFFRRHDRLDDDTERIYGRQAECLMRESAFSAVLIGERKRSERTLRPFVLALFNVEHIVGVRVTQKTVSRNEVLGRLIGALHHYTRQIDRKGWARFGRSIGVIFAETGREALPVLELKINTILLHAGGIDIQDRIPVTWGIFPQDHDSHATHDAIGSALFYPEASVGRETDAGRIVKRFTDIFGSVLGILLFAPFFIVIPILIKCTSGGPVFFRQERIGEAGRRFTFLKFRSMYAGTSETVHREYIKKYISGSIENGGEGKRIIYKLTADPRITPVGRILRKISFDELPQLFNVLFGDMSLVGPRPAIPYEVELYQLWHRQRIYMKPGITGRWQVKGRSSTTFDGMVRMDIQYHKRWSLYTDIKLMLLTTVSMFTMRGAY